MRYSKRYNTIATIKKTSDELIESYVVARDSVWFIPGFPI